MDYVSNRVFDGTRPLSGKTADALRAMHKRNHRKKHNLEGTMPGTKMEATQVDGGWIVKWSHEGSEYHSGTASGATKEAALAEAERALAHHQADALRQKQK